MHTEVFKGINGKWYLRLVNIANGQTQFVSESYFSKWNAERAAAKLGLPVTVITDAVQE